MRTSQYLLSTLKNVPVNTENISHQLMLRAGMIRKLASGLYIWLPTGFRILKKVESIIREEMNKIGAMEIAMPIVQPSKLWKKSGRWKQYGLELLRFVDRNRHSLILSPTHEEAITELINNEVSSYKELPLIFFQIQTKFRDEIRPRFGVMRSREFIMKDAYSIHDSERSLEETYDKMYKIYSNIFTRIGLNFNVIQADNGSIGGNISHEFQVLTKSGEDYIVFSDSSNYAASIDFAEALAPSTPRMAAKEDIKLVDTPNIKTTSDLVEKFNIPITKIVKTIVVKSVEGSPYPMVALLIRGDHYLNKTKAEKIPQVANPLTFISEKEIRSIINADLSSLGPINMPIPLIVDQAVAAMSDFIAGANINGKHYFGINWDRDVKTPIVADLRNVVVGDPSPDGKGKIIIERGIEIGHIFQLGVKYSQSMNACFQDKNGFKQIFTMGCYGIGITRVVAALVEQCHSRHGITWPNSVAPFQVVILPIKMHQSSLVRKVSEKLYFELLEKDIDVLIDDRKEYLGVMFKDIELIGIPHIIIVSDNNLNKDYIEYRYRNGKKQMIKCNRIIEFLVEIIKK